jgi:hypothetical protein
LTQAHRSTRIGPIGISGSKNSNGATGEEIIAEQARDRVAWQQNDRHVSNHSERDRRRGPDSNATKDDCPQGAQYRNGVISCSMRRSAGNQHAIDSLDEGRDYRSDDFEVVRQNASLCQATLILTPSHLY